MKKLYALLLCTLATAPALAQWNTDATPVCIYNTSYVGEDGKLKSSDYNACNPMIARTPDQKTWISWKTWGHKTINGDNYPAVRTYLQLLDRDGVPQFDEPIMVNDHISPTWWSKYALCVAPDGSAIVTVSDSRAIEGTYSDPDNSPSAFSPAIYKIDQEGNFLWGLDGVEYTQYDYAAYTNAYVIGDDTFFIFYNQAPDNGEVSDATGTYIQRINDDGTPDWAEPLKWSTAFIQPQLLPSLDGDFLLFDKTADGSRVHRMDRDLNEQWGEPVYYDEHAYGGYEMNHYRIVSDGNGGACVAFQRFMGNTSHNVRVQHINEDGSLGFGLTGLDAYNEEAYDHNYPSIAANGQTREILVQFASELESTGNVMHQKFSYDGDYLYPETGKSIASKDYRTNAYFYGLTGVGALDDGSWISIYRDITFFDQESIIIRRYDQDGNRTWTRTIGRNLAASDINFVVEPEATYLVYREYNVDKEPGIKIFRINHDGGYDVDYQAAIATTSRAASQPRTTYFSAGGQQLQQPQRGLNIVRHGDGTTTKYVAK